MEPRTYVLIREGRSALQRLREETGLSEEAIYREAMEGGGLWKTHRNAMHLIREGLIAREEVLRENLPLVRWYLNTRNLPEALREDLEAVGMAALLRAIDKFDPRKGVFSSYAVSWIRSAVEREALRLIAGPSLGLEAKRKALAEKGEDADRLLHPLRLDAEIEGLDGVCYGDAIPAEGSVEEEVEQRLLDELVQEAIDRLGEREAAYVRAAMEGRSLSEIAREEGISRQAVSQVHRRGLKRLGLLLQEAFDAAGY